MPVRRWKGAALRLEEDIPADCRVMASLPHLTQVIRNLLENACRYAPEESAVRISARSVGSGEGAEVVFRVTDNGPGIPTADLERVFERFYQVERHRCQASTGLGLAICKHIVERHGGRIRAESPTQDGGTALGFHARPGASRTQRKKFRWSGKFMKENLLAQNVSVFYGQNKALHEVSLGFAPQKATALIGPSGLRQVHVFALPEPNE